MLQLRKTVRLAPPQEPQFHIKILGISKNTTNTICLGVQHWLKAEPVTLLGHGACLIPPNMINKHQRES